MLQSVAQHNASKLACNWPACLAFTTILAQHNTSLQLACLSRIYLDSCSVYKVLAEAEVNLRNANLEHISSTVAHFTIREEGAGDIDESKGTYKAGGRLYGVIQLRARTGFSLQQADEACAFVHIEKPRAKLSHAGLTEPQLGKHVGPEAHLPSSLLPITLQPPLLPHTLGRLNDGQKTGKDSDRH